LLTVGLLTENGFWRFLPGAKYSQNQQNFKKVDLKSLEIRAIF